ncbi:proline-rich transmembrane protein 4 [Myripristis murdjan]|uniref:proline-rich transmembrane protein 4 n=1 Tax=Myripristis murdjan TaxID=586833 RepID=UPI0011760BD4|nr:proline-rich transmembrane protein 4 [Myripristis murdjan]
MPTMFSSWNLYLLLSFFLPLSLHVVASALENVTETPKPDTETEAQHLPQSSQRPSLAATHPLFVPEMTDFLALPLNWPSSSFDEADRQGVIGEYSDIQESSEMSVLYPSEKWFTRSSPTESAAEIMTSKEYASPKGSLSASVSPNTTQEQAFQHGPTENSTWDINGSTQTAETQTTLSAKENEATVGHLPAPPFGSLTSASPDLDNSSALSTGPGPSPEHPTPPPATGSWALTTDPSVNTQGKLQEWTEQMKETGDGLYDFTDHTLHRGATGTEADKDESSKTEQQDSKTSGTFSLSEDNMNPTVTPCKISNQSWTPVYQDDFTSNDSLDPSVAFSPPLFVPLYSDWNSALATWGLAWELHIYGLGSVFTVFGLISVVCLLGLPLLCPPGGLCFTLLHLFLLAFAGIRAFCLLYDAYSHQDRLPPLGSLLLSELPFPCLTSAFSLAFLLISLRLRTRLSLPLSLSTSFSALPRPCLLVCLSLLHFGISLGCVGLLQVLPTLPALIFLLPLGVFVCLSVFLSCFYLIFYCFMQAETKHIYRLNDNGESGGSPEMKRPASCPFYKVEDWGRAAAAGVGASLCLLGCGGLQLYGILHALGLGGVSGYGFQPWPWWGYQVACRLCEVGVCLSLSLIGTQPLFCHTNSSIRIIGHQRPGNWSRLSCGSPSGGLTVPSQGGVNSPVLPSHCSWSQDKQERLVVCEVITKGQSEALPLCSIVDAPQNGLNSAPHPSQTRISILPLPTPPSPPREHKSGVEPQLSSLDSLGLDTDSTVDLRPPSPIDLSRSIDQALFSEALFSHSLFGLPRLLHTSSSLSLSSPSKGTLKQGPNAVENVLYRTSSCGDMDQENPLSNSRPSQPRGTVSFHNKPPSSPEHWRRRGGNSGSLCRASQTGSSQGLCCSPREAGKMRPHPWANKGQSFTQNSLPRAIPHLPYHRRYRTLSLASQDSQGSGRLAGTEHLSESKQLEQDLAVQAEFINVCRQIDSLSVCSDTIEL